MLFEYEGLKLLCEITTDDENGCTVVKLLSLFSRDITYYADSLDLELMNKNLGKVKDCTIYNDAEMAFITLSVNGINRNLINSIYETLKDSATHCLPSQRENEQIVLNTMISRRLLISYENGSVSDYTLNKWMNNITIE